MEIIASITGFGLVCFLVGYLTGAGRMAGRLGYKPTLLEKLSTLLPNYGRKFHL
jgi:hypothetical protein